MAGKIRKSNLHDDVKTMVTDMISEQALDSANFDSVLASKTTDDITEGSTNQYYTSTRADSDFDIRLATKTTGDISEGSNLYYTTSRADSDFDVRLATKTTDNLTEGSNQYYTDARADARIAAASLTDISDADQTVRTTDNVTFADLTLTGSLIGPSTMYVDPAPVDSDAGLLVIRGDLQVDGTTTTVNSTTVSINDKNIVLADSAANASEADGAGITVNGASATIQYDAADDLWEFNKAIKTTNSNLFINEQRISTNGNGEVGIGYGKSGTGNIFAVYDGTTGEFFVERDGDVLIPNGNVGIGTNSPDTALNVVSSSTQAKFEGSVQGNIIIEKSGTEGFAIFSNAAGTLGFYDNNSSAHRLRITSDGDVGIGTNSPSALLHLYSSANDTPLYIDTGNANGAHLRFLQAGSVKHFLGCGGGISLGDKDDLTMRAYDNILFASGNSSTERMRITSNGDVSIGSGHAGFSGWRVLNMRQLSTGALINFEDDDGTRAFTFASQGSGMRYQAHISGGYHRWETNATANALYITDGGNVGIGTNNPAASLDVSGGNVRLDGGWNMEWGSGYGGGAASIWSDAATTSKLRFAPTGNSGGIVMEITDSNTYITSNVRIGSTTIGNEKLNIAFSGRGGMQVGSTNGSGAYIVLDGAADGDASGGDYAYIEHNSSGALAFNTGNVNNSTSTKMVIEAAGNVGIGNPNPPSLFTLGKSIVGYEDLFTITNYNADNDVMAAIGFDQSDDTLVIRNDQSFSTGGIEFRAGGSNSHMFIKTGGNVGIGTTNPLSKLDVNGNLKLYNASSDPSGTAGDMYYNTTDKTIKYHNGSNWVKVVNEVTPDQFSNLYCWWDFNGTYSNIGSGNSTISDASGNGYTLTENGTCTTEAFPSGRNGIRVGANAGDHWYYSNAVPQTGSNARTLFAIFYNIKETNLDPLYHVMHYGEATTNKAFGIVQADADKYFQQHTWGGNGTTSSPDAYTMGQTGNAGIMIVFSIYTGSGGKLRIYDDGTATGVNYSSSYSTNTGNTYGIRVGSRINETNSNEAGDVVIGECGAYTRELSDGEMDSIANGFLARWL